MSRLYDTIEPSVVDETLLRSAVEEQGPKGEAEKVAKQEGLDFEYVASLRLDFKNILKIDNLRQFTSLVKLQLDNNIIEKIEGLSLLRNLRWLDLSFNNIEVIEGLDSLTKITDLTLHNNRIERLEGIDMLPELNVLSIGNNKLEKLDNVIYLRRFSNLKTLNLAGNPLSNETNYTAFVYAHLPELVYLDYRLVSDMARTAALEEYRYAIEELAHDENIALRKLQESQQEAKQTAIEKEAFVDGLKNATLFKEMFEEDTEADKLVQMPGVNELLALYEEDFSEICNQLCSYGLEEHGKRQEEIAAFYECINAAISDNKTEGVNHLQAFEEYKQKLFSDLIHIADQDIVEGKLKEADDEVQLLWDNLMALELQLVDQLEETIKDFERNMLDLIASFNEHVKTLMSQCRDLENSHHEKLSDIAMATLEQFMKSEIGDDFTDELRMLLVDKDTVLNAVASSHDAHSTRIDSKEDAITTSSENMANSLRNKILDNEVRRNRNRIMEINNMVDHFRDEVDNFELGPN